MNVILTRTLTTALFATLCFACSSSNNSTAEETGVSSDPVDTRPFETVELELDFTLSLVQAGIDSGELQGVALDAATEERLLLADDGALLRLGEFGNFISRVDLPTQASKPTGLASIDSKVVAFSSEDARLFKFGLDSGELTETADLSEFTSELQALSYSAQDLTLYAVNALGPKTLFAISEDGAVNRTELSSRFNEYSITGADFFQDSLYLSSTGHSDSPGQALVLEISTAGEFVKAYALGEVEPSSLLIEDIDTGEIITTNFGAERNIILFEAPAQASEITEEPLNLLDTIELDIDQPSGVDFDPASQSLYFVTDFGEVHRLVDGGPTENLFSLSPGQGNIESIAIDHAVAGQLHLLFSDDSNDGSSIASYSASGELVGEIDLEGMSGETFEAMDLTPSGKLYTVTASAMMRKRLLKITGAATESVELPAIYDGYVFTGIDVSDDETQAVLVTDESVDDDERFAGLAVLLNLNTLEELDRYSIAVPGDDGDLEGLPAPSGIAFDSNTGVFYISSDVDDAELYAFEIKDD